MRDECLRRIFERRDEVLVVELDVRVGRRSVTQWYVEIQHERQCQQQQRAAPHATQARERIEIEGERGQHEEDGAMVSEGEAESKGEPRPRRRDRVTG